MVAIVDNRSLVEAIGSTSQVTEKKLVRDICSIKDMVSYDNLTVYWVPTGQQLADIMTKAGANPGNLIQALSKGQLQWLEKHF